MIWTNVVLGLGFGMSFPILSAAALSTVDRERMGYATSLFNMLQQQGRAIGIAWMTLYGLSVSRLRAVVTAPRVRRWMERTTGTVLVGFGARLALDRV